MTTRRSNGTRISKRSRLLCPLGCGLKHVVFIDPASYRGNPLTCTRVVLACGHERGEILPTRLGCVSFEDVKTVRGDAAFPIQREEMERN